MNCELTFEEDEKALTDAELELIASAPLPYLMAPRRASNACFFCSLPTNSILQICDACRAVGEDLARSNKGSR
jgi:hypothetical protein